MRYLPIFYQLLFFPLFLSYQATLPSSSSSSSATQLCSHDQSAALIQFKALFSINKTASKHCEIRSYPKTNSWRESIDCCLWDGVNCDNITGQVISLDLSCSWLSGTLPSSSSLFLLSHLQRLDLSVNDFKKSKISSKFGLFSSLTHLDLSRSWFSGRVPYEISYLSKLVSLDLSSASAIDLISQSFESVLKLEQSTLNGIFRNLTEVRDISFDGINMSSVDPNSFMNLSYSLTSVSLTGCDLRGTFPENSFNLPKIKYLTLFNNPSLSGQLPNSNWSSPLEDLVVSGTSFSGELPESIGNLKSLRGLGLIRSNFLGSIPRSLGNLSHLGFLFLSYNNFSGKIPSSLTNLTQLRILALNFNRLEGCIPDNPNAFPNLGFLDLSDNLLSGTTPSWLYTHPSLNVLDLGNNQFIGHIKEFQQSVLDYINFKNNTFQGTIPRSISKLVNLTFLDLSSNSLNGTISWDIFSKLQNLTLVILDLSHNNLSGIIPQCIGSFSKSLSSLNLKMNKLHGIIPPTFARGCGLKNLNLNSNHLEGPLTRSISNCKDLEVLDLGNNKINDTFPHWIVALSELQVLVLHSNKFQGWIGASKNPQSLSKLRIIDLSQNNFFGPLPISFIKNFKGMMNLDEGKAVRYMEERDNAYDYSYDYSVALVVKGLEIELVKILTVLTTTDLSGNNFEGEIPRVIGELNSLRGLNLSHNNLVGHVPPSLGNLSQLEWLDLSSNKLDGQIPRELVDLTFLSFFNVSNNQLVGPIPQGKQFNTFENDSYEGNKGLCGLPLSIACSSNEPRQPPPSMNSHNEDGSKFEFGWEVVLIGYGFGFIFGVAMGYVAFRARKPKWFVTLVEGGHSSKQIVGERKGRTNILRL
ncbi:Receptor like protein 53, putative [Theobroma cacao]|uniref:Receptor like protein 53, putative n=1 Tax=Theobroma cacao TaxID=3641 RepID=A0A061FAC5_THECC|nr:Receptor like protein 53, putative [Theobroma cacao]